MSTYRGKATLLSGDGSLVGEVDAALTAPETAGAQEPWFGTIWGDFDAFDLMESVPSVRLPGGREAPFRLSRTDLVLPRLGTGIVGIDEPPF